MMESGFFANAGSIMFSPNTWTQGMYCKKSVDIIIDTQGIKARAVDVKVFFDENSVQISNITGYLSYGSYFPSSLSLLQGFSLQAVTYPWISYPASSRYFYINRSDTSFQSGSTPFAGFMIQSTGTNLTGKIDFYVISGLNYDDSNIQSWIINKFVDVISTFNSGFFQFLPQPCIIDNEAPIITGFQSLSGQQFDIQSSSGFTLLMYDRLGSSGDSYTNNSFHYRFQTGVANISNLNNYVPVGVNEIDNQYGINTWSFQLTVSGVAGSGVLLPPTLLTWIDCSFPYSGPWYPLTRNRNLRGMQCRIPINTLNIQSNQTIKITWIINDYPNQFNEIHTWNVEFTLQITGVLQSWTIENLIIAWPEKRAKEAVTYITSSWNILTEIIANQSPAWFNALKNLLFIPWISWSLMTQFTTKVSLQQPLLSSWFNSIIQTSYTTGYLWETQLPKISGYNDQSTITTGNMPPNLWMQWVIEFITTWTKQLISTWSIIINHLWYGIMTGNIIPGIYDIGFKSNAHLRKILRNINVGSSYHVFDFTSGGSYFLKAWDFYQDNTINDIDLSTLLWQYLSGDRLTDITLNGQVNDIDLSVLLGNYLFTGEQY